MEYQGVKFNLISECFKTLKLRRRMKKLVPQLNSGKITVGDLTRELYDVSKDFHPQFRRTVVFDELKNLVDLETAKKIMVGF